MAITIETYADEVKFAQYAQPRMRLLSIIDTGVYPNIKLLLKEFAEFNARLAPGGDLEEFKPHDDEIAAKVRPATGYIVQYLSAAAQIFEGIEAEAPGTFPGVAAYVAAEKAQQESEFNPE